MKYYLYDEKTKQFIKEQEGYLDPLETKAQGKDVYIVPPFSTTEKPDLTSLKDNEILVFKGDKWQIEQEFYVGKIVDCQGERVSKYVTDNDLTFEKCDGGFKIVEKPVPPKKTESMILIEKYQSEIVELKKYLSDTDYKAIKFAEGELSESDYQEVKSQRHDARARINELESLIEELEKGNNTK
jgi:hypothetical protein